MEFEQTPRQQALHRPLVAADPHIDPHRLVAVCCQYAGAEPLGVSLLLPVEDEARPWSESTARAERLLTDADLLMHAAGIDLEEVVFADRGGQTLEELVRLGGFDALLICATDHSESFGVLPLVVRLAREHGLDVIDTGPRLDHPGWLRRVVGPLLHLRT